MLGAFIKKAESEYAGDFWAEFWVKSTDYYETKSADCFPAVDGLLDANMSAPKVRNLAFTQLYSVRWSMVKVESNAL